MIKVTCDQCGVDLTRSDGEGTPRKKLILSESFVPGGGTLPLADWSLVRHPTTPLLPGGVQMEFCSTACLAKKFTPKKEKK